MNTLFFVQYIKSFAMICKSLTALKITAGQRSLTVVKASVTAEKPCRTVTMTRHYLDIATAFINFNSFAISSKTIFTVI